MNDDMNGSGQLNMPIRHYVTKRLITVDHETSIQKGAARMVEFNISSLGIVKDKSVVGIITDTDLKKRALAAGLSPETPVHKIMTRAPVTVDINSPVREVLEVMSREKVKHVFVTDRDKVIGVTTLQDLEDIDPQHLETLISRD